MKYLEARWLWLQQQTRAKGLHVGTVDTELNSADVVTKFHPRLRFVELSDEVTSESRHRFDDESGRRGA